jgi:chromosomal replication initiation ATPase DnaA
VFLYTANKYQKEYKKIPVLIIDNANRLAEKQQRLLEHVQDYAKRAADNGTATIVFVSSEGRVPRRMIGILTLFIALFTNSYILTKSYREKLVVKTWGDSRNW